MHSTLTRAAPQRRLADASSIEPMPAYKYLSLPGHGRRRRDHDASSILLKDLGPGKATPDVNYCMTMPNRSSQRHCDDASSTLPQEGAVTQNEDVTTGSTIPPQESPVPLDDPDVWLNFNEAKHELAKRIERMTRKKNVMVSESFFTSAKYQIVSKNRDERMHKKQWLLSEQDTCYENLTPEKTTYTFQTCFEQTSSVTLMISKGHSFSIGAAAGGGFGGNVGLTGGAEFRKSRSAGEGESHTETKQLMVAVPVPPETAVVAKELVYHTECLAECHLLLLLGIKKPTFKGTLKRRFKDSVKLEDEIKKKDETEIVMKYTTNGKEEEINVSSLLEDPHLEKQPWVSKLGDTICIKLSSHCTFTKTEHTLETFYLKSDFGRLMRIMPGRQDPRNSASPSPKMEGSETLSGDKYVVKCDFTGSTVKEIPLKKGHTVIVFERSENGWCRGISEGIMGWFPDTYVEPAFVEIL